MVDDPEPHTETAAASSRAPQPQPSTSARAASGKRRRNTALPTNCCRTCRARKVKCTGNPGNGPCSNCARLDLTCTFTLTGGDGSQESISRTIPSRSYTEAGTLRKRAQRACHQCHLHKTKCSGDLPQCKRCVSVGLACQYVPAKRKYSSIPHQAAVKTEKESEPSKVDVQTQARDDPSPRAATQDSDKASVSDDSEVDHLIAEKSLLNYTIIRTHLHAWFELLHPLQCYGFFHPETTFREVEEQKFSSILSAGICAATALYVSPNPEGRAFAERCNIWVKFHISRTAGTLTKERLALLILSFNYDLTVGDWPRIWEYCSTASRIVTAMQSNWDATTGSFTEQESSRRQTWQVYCIDRILAGGFDEHLTLREEYLRLSLPRSDHAFQSNQPAPAARLDHPPRGNQGRIEPSLSAYYVRVMSIRHSILGTTKAYALLPSQRPPTHQVDPFTLLEDVKRLQLQLNVLTASLPASLQISEANIQSNYDTPEWPAFVMLHTWVYQLHYDLYRFSIPGHRESATWELLNLLPPEFVQDCRYQAVASEITLARFWESCHRLTKRQPRGLVQIMAADTSMPVCMIQSIKILLITRQHQFFFDIRSRSTIPAFRDEPVDDAVLAGLVGSNLALLDAYQKVMPKVGDMARDIREAAANYRVDEQVDKTTMMIGMPSVQPLEEIRLPGPHYVLENAHVNQKLDDEANRQRSASLADKYLKKKNASSTSDAASPTTATVNTPPGYTIGPPDMPALLTNARAAGGMSIPPDTGPALQTSQDIYASYDFNMAGVITNIPTFSLMPSDQDTILDSPYNTANTPFYVSNPSPQEQFILAAQQAELHMPLYAAPAQHHDPATQQYNNIPYRWSSDEQRGFGST